MNNMTPPPANVNGPVPSRLAAIKTFIGDTKEIIAGVAALGAAIFTVYNYFITRDEFDKVNCQLRQLTEINSLELQEKKFQDFQDSNSREIVRLDLIDNKTTFDSESLAKYRMSQASITPQLATTTSKINELKKAAMLGQCKM